MELRRRGEAFGAHRRRGHSGGEIGGLGPGEILGRVFGRQHLDHLLVFDPHLDHVEVAAVAVKAVPAFPLGDGFDCIGAGGDAEREMGGTRARF